MGDSPFISLTFDEVVLWLNDRIGTDVYASVEQREDIDGIVVLRVQGALAHWSTDWDLTWFSTEFVDALAAYYKVGETTHLGFSDLVAAQATWDNRELTIRLADGIIITIGERRDSR